MRSTAGAAAIALTLAASSIRGQAPEPPSAPLTICHAGSLTAAFTEVEKAFIASHPNVAIKDLAGGSVTLARQLATGALTCDVYASADYLDIELLLEPARLADYTIKIAEGRMVLAYLATDAKAKDLPVVGSFSPPESIPVVGPRWYDTVLATGVRLAGAHPFSDPSAYRSHLIFQLAEIFYKKPGLYNTFIDHYTVIPADPTNPASAAVLGREFNFQITYEHSAIAAARSNASYRFARLPDDIALSVDSKNSVYAQASITMPGVGRPGAPSSVVIPGSRTAWGVTIVKASANQTQATAFLGLLLGPVGAAALKTNGPAPVSPPTANAKGFAHLPASLRTLVARSEK